MNEISEKYVAKALEGYEHNYNGITEAIGQMKGKLEELVFQQGEMQEGIIEMRELLGLEAEELDPSTEAAPTPLSLVNQELGEIEHGE